jgi:hypothetical protein
MNLVVTLKLRSAFNDFHERLLIYLKGCGMLYVELSLLRSIILFCLVGVGLTPFCLSAGG